MQGSGAADHEEYSMMCASPTFMRAFNKFIHKCNLKVHSQLYMSHSYINEI